MHRIALCALVASCTSWSGPHPLLSSVTPSSGCDAQASVALILTGTGFSVEVLSALDDPTAVVPSVRLIDPSANATTFASAPDSFGDTLMIAVQGLGPATYDVEVVDPNADGSANATDPATTSTLAAALTIDSPPTAVSVMPPAATASSATTLTIAGSAFLPTMTATLAATPPVAATAVTVAADGKSATATFDLTGTALGSYAITVDNRDGCTSTLASAFEAQ